MNLLRGYNLKSQKNDGLREPPDQVVCKQSASMSPSACVHRSNDSSACLWEN